eukprot:1252266-Rhodomonas_salina.1
MPDPHHDGHRDRSDSEASRCVRVCQCIKFQKLGMLGSAGAGPTSTSTSTTTSTRLKGLKMYPG